MALESRFQVTARADRERHDLVVDRARGQINKRLARYRELAGGR
jgi:hypothetical protein